MHLALITHRFVKGDGQGRVNLEVATAALQRGWRVTLVAAEVDASLLAMGDVHWARIDVGRWPSALLRHQLFAVASARWVARHRAEIDVVQANGFITWARAEVNAAHFIHTAWLGSPYRARGARRSLRSAYHLLYALLNAALERWAYRRSARVVAVSEQVRAQLLQIGVPPDRVSVIPNGVDTGEFAPRVAPEHGPPGGAAPVTGLFVGDLQTPRKNLQTVLRALGLCPRVRLRVVGTVGSSDYPRLARELGVADRVEFMGYRSDVPALMRASDFVVFASLYEPSGLVLLEGMASGVPVVTARTVGGTELIAEDCAIVLDDPEDVEATAAACNRLAASPELRARMGAAGRERALALDFKRMAAQYCALFDGVAAAGRSGGAPP
jgi:glycosyltransferase involved in cell wall biosynthesis